MNFLHVCLHFLLLASENCSAVNSAADNQKEEQNNHDRFAQELKQKFSQTTHISQVNIDLKYLCTYSSNLLWHHYWGFHEYIAYQRIKSLLRAICGVSWMSVIKIFAVPVII